METIKSYLDNIFKTLPKTESILKLKGELLSNMEEKYRSLKSEGKSENEAIGTVISEFGNIDELLNEMEIDIPANDGLPVISTEEAEKYVQLKKKTSIWVGIGVVLCILGAATLILTSQLIEDGFIFNSLTHNLKDSLPVIFLLIIVVPGVALFIYSGITMEKYKFIDDGAFSISSATKTCLREKRESISGRHKVNIILGVCLCILSPIAIFLGDAISENGSVYGVSVLLIIVATAVFLFITSGSMDEAYKKLTKEGEYNPVKRKNDKVIGAVASVVWPIAVCIFLLWGFLYNGWGICWIVFPITGILFGGFCSVYNALKSENSQTITKQ